ncbi:hypothetical protein [Pontibacter kalidii]|uniref:hypothetical protein n=1 Tax=Pontibacter kalidii TaxID=2592049 RepID=UPI002253E4AC|nr:hypothetical protein [Pontibacter kalidii]
MEAGEKEKVIVVKETDVCTIKVDLSLSLLTVYCKQHMEGHEVRQNMTDMLVIVDTYKLRYLLGNVRALHYLKLEDANWLWNTLLPTLRASTVLKWARVEDPFSMVELNSLQVKKRLETEGVAKSELQFESFVDEESALHWLLYSDE